MAEREGRTPPPTPTKADLDRIMTVQYGPNYREAAAEALSEEKTDIYMAISGTNLNKVIRDGGKLKSSIETGKGSFKTIGEDRFKLEKNVFGLSDDALDDYDLLPKYGFLAGKNGMDYDNIVGFGYGENFIRFKPSARRKATATLGDSFNGNAQGQLRPAPATPLNDVQDRFLWPTVDFDDSGKLMARRDYTEFAKRDADRFMETRDYRDLTQSAGAEYIEVQMYGRLTLDDVAAIEVESKKFAASLSKSLRKKGFDEVEVVPSRHNSRLKAIWENRLDSVDSLSAKDITNLGDAYMDKIFKLRGEQLFTTGFRLGQSAFKFPGSLNAIRDKMVARYGDRIIADLGTDISQRTAASNALRESLTAADKREILTEWYRLIEQGKDGGMPKNFLIDYRKTKAGFTDDVFNPKLLESYEIVDNVPATPPSST